MNSEHCKNCNKEIFNDGTSMFEDYNQTSVHDQFKCHNFLHHKKQFEKMEDDLQKLKEDMKKIEEMLF